MTTPEPAETPLAGGWMNPGAVVRIGDTVHRPATPATIAHQALAAHVRKHGGPLVPEPRGVDSAGRECWEYVDGYVPHMNPEPWVASAATVRAVAKLLRRFHDAARGFQAPADAAWDLSKVPVVGPIVGHNDVCPKNVVFRDGQPVAFIDLDLTGPTYPLTDLGTLAYMWIMHVGSSPTGGDALQWCVAAAEGYGWDAVDVDEYADGVLAAVVQSSVFMRTRWRDGVEPFASEWQRTGGEAERTRRETWWRERRGQLVAALTQARR